MTMNNLFKERVKDFYDNTGIVYQWSRKASTALRENNFERFHEYMCLVALCEYNHYKTKRFGRRRALEAWKNYVFHLRRHNVEFYEP